MNILARLVFCLFLLAAVSPAGARQDALSPDFPDASVSSPSVEVAFSPYGHALELILKVIGRAEKSVHVAAFPFTSHAVSEALLQAKNRGVEVKITADKEANSDKPTALGFLAGQGVEVRLNGNYAVMHNKFIIVDERHVQTGSFNYTKSAAGKNAENVLIVWNDSATAALYKVEWQRLWNEGTVLKMRGKRRE